MRISSACCHDAEQLGSLHDYPLVLHRRRHALLPACRRHLSLRRVRVGAVDGVRQDMSDTDGQGGSAVEAIVRTPDGDTP